MTNLLVIGASVRAAVQSAIRAGFCPRAIDLFGDRDLKELCETTVIAATEYPQAFVELARRAPKGPLMYTGALENWPEVVDAISRERPLWGNTAACLRRVRDPFALHGAIRAADLPCPEVRRFYKNVLDRRWLAKPIIGHTSHLQEFIEGESHSGVFVADVAGCRLLGVTKQLVGTSWLHAPAFRYSGSIGPLSLSVSELAHWNRLGTAVAEFAGLRGIFGIDAIMRDGVPWPVEVNPRYTASVEILEYASGIRALESHGNVWHGQETMPHQMSVAAESPGPTSMPGDVVGKAIWYAPRTLNVPSGGPWEATLCEPPPLDEPPAFADIPHAGERIAKGRPVMTSFAQADTVEECEQKLRAIAEALPC